MRNTVKIYMDGKLESQPNLEAFSTGMLFQRHVEVLARLTGAKTIKFEFVQYHTCNICDKVEVESAGVICPACRKRGGLK